MECAFADDALSSDLFRCAEMKSFVRGDANNMAFNVIIADHRIHDDYVALHKMLKV